MELERFKQEFPEAAEAYIKENNYLNPLQAFENYYFGKRNVDNYRVAAIEKCIKERIGFTSTQNSAFNIFSKYIRPTCPICSKLMTGKRGGGSGHMGHYEYECECGSKVDISFTYDAVDFDFSGVK